MIESTQLAREETREVLRRGSKNIAPLWSLENFVAVNPYLGMTDMSFSQAMKFLSTSSDSKMALPPAYYLNALKNGKLTKKDIEEALSNHGSQIDESVDEFLYQVENQKHLENTSKIKIFSDVASEVNGKKWLRFMIDRISFWASAYFDKNQAIWKTSPQDQSIFKAWKREAEVDYSPEAMGLKGFRRFVKQLPDDYLEASSKALKALGIHEDTTEHYLNGLLFKMNGWAGFTARIDWDAHLEKKDSHALEEFLSVMLVWEMAFRELLPYENLNSAWNHANELNRIAVQEERLNQNQLRILILQEAFDLANQRALIQRINSQKKPNRESVTSKIQAIFCIDVRSELYRRNLEAANDEIETLGFAGFFGFPINYIPMAHEEGTDQCPVLLKPSYTVKETMEDADDARKAIEKRKLWEQVLKSWKSFKTGAISCFSFVSPLGIFFLPKLLSDSFGITRPVPQPQKSGLSKKAEAKKTVRLQSESVGARTIGISLENQIEIASSALKAMSLTDDFARIVFIVGHGATTINNPHATGLDCGACGGHSGESNAKVAALVLNNSEVRKGLKASGISIPDSTVFIAGLHDTTTDQVKILSSTEIPDSHKDDLMKLEYSLKVAGETSRMERASRMKINNGDIAKKVLQRSKDWSQVRPEWGLAGCSSFIVAPRERTSQLNFDGKAFMHNYSWQKDSGFNVLESIMTAPMVVTSWINLQYYASTVDNKKFGAGNKTLHNVVGGLGVLEGFGGDLRVGLPWQSVHDGEQFQHEPQRLNVIIEAPVDEISKILNRHASIRNLCDNEWIYLLAINNEGKVAYRYIGDLEWELV